jgi:hypothetical protein
MHIALRVADGFCIFLALLLAAKLSHPWMRLTTITAAIGIAMMGLVYYGMPPWLGGVPAVMIDVATFGLAVLGGHVAINPPEKDEKELKRFYICAFVGLAIFGIGANMWERNIEEAKRVQSQTDLKTAQSSFSTDLAEVKKSTVTILSFVTNPPKGISIAQAVLFAQGLLSRQVSPGRLQSVSNDRINDMAQAIVANLNEMAQEWQAQEHNDYMRTIDTPCYGTGSTPAGCKAAEARWAIAQRQLVARWQDDVTNLISQANECRVEIFNRLLPLQKAFAGDDTAKTLFEKMVTNSSSISPDNLRAAGTYLENLRKRLP